LLHGGWSCWGVDELLSTDTRGNDEDKKEKEPGNILIPAEGQENAKVVTNGVGNTHQLRTLIPQKDTLPMRRSGTIGT